MFNKIRGQALGAVLVAAAIALLAHIGATQARSAPLASGQVAAAEVRFRTIALDWLDPRRNRAVPALLYWPQGDPPSARTLVVFSHGLGSSREGYSYLGRYWARRGIASLHVQHIGSDRSLWIGNPAGLADRFRNAASDQEAIARVADTRFALDRLLASAHGPGIDRRRIVAAGHSYGANTTLLLSGARVERNGQVLDLADHRFSAAIVLSAPPFYGSVDMGPILSGIRIPTLHVTTVDDQILVPGFESSPEDRRRVFDAIGGFKVLAVYRHGTHNVFTEKRYLDSLAVASEVKSATESLTDTFLGDVFDRRTALAHWADAHPGLLADYVVRR